MALGRNAVGRLQISAFKKNKNPCFSLPKSPEKIDAGAVSSYPQLSKRYRTATRKINEITKITELCIIITPIFNLSFILT